MQPTATRGDGGEGSPNLTDNRLPIIVPDMLPCYLSLLLLLCVFVLCNPLTRFRRRDVDWLGGEVRRQFLVFNVEFIRFGGRYGLEGPPQA